jgi:hypothetical protein
MTGGTSTSVTEREKKENSSGEKGVRRGPFRLRAGFCPRGHFTLFLFFFSFSILFSFDFFGLKNFYKTSVLNFGQL